MPWRAIVFMIITQRDEIAASRGVEKRVRIARTTHARVPNRRGVDLTTLGAAAVRLPGRIGPSDSPRHPAARLSTRSLVRSLLVGRAKMRQGSLTFARFALNPQPKTPTPYPDTPCFRVRDVGFRVSSIGYRV